MTTRGGITLSTLILLPDGSHRPVSTLKDGDEVITIDETYHIYKTARVANMKRVKARDFATITVGSYTVGCDATHEFLIGVGWLSVRDDVDVRSIHILTTTDPLFPTQMQQYPHYCDIDHRKLVTRSDGIETTLNQSRFTYAESCCLDSLQREDLVIFDVIGGHANIVTNHLVSRMFA